MRSGVNEDTDGIEEASSAMEAAMVMTNKDGISHPNTIPTCPPGKEMPVVKTDPLCTWFVHHIPDIKGKENVEDTDAMTPMIEKAKAIVSMICNNKTAEEKRSATSSQGHYSDRQD